MNNLDVSIKIYEKIDLLKEVFIEYYGENKRKYIEEVLDNIVFITHFNTEYVINRLGNIDEIKFLINDKEENDKIKNETILNTRKKYRQILKSTLGDNIYKQYNDIVHISKRNPEYIPNIPTNDKLLKELIKEEKNTINMILKSIIKISEEYDMNMKKLRSYDFDNKYYSYGLDEIIEGDCTSYINFIKGKRKDIIVLYLDSNNNDLDLTLIHEINHCIERKCGLLPSSQYIERTGFTKNKSQVYNEEFSDDEEVEEETDKYDYFSEVINDLISMNIWKIMHEKHISILDDYNKSKGISESYYMKYKDLVIDFYGAFRAQIEEARYGCNLKPLFNIVGKDNFNKLNDIINKYVEHDSEDINKYKEESDKIIMKMKRR